MANSFIEGELNFHFTSEWSDIFKFDIHTDYKKIKDLVPNTKGIDFIGVQNNRIYFLEVTDFRAYKSDESVQAQLKNNGANLMIEVGEKIKNSLACILAATRNSTNDSELWLRITNLIKDSNRQVTIILWIEEDRMDYLTRDSFFSGVAEGIIGYDRIITMMNVADEQLVIEEKGIYSIEKFLMARRLMYWQVYLHKTVISAEIMLIAVLNRARYLAISGIVIPSSDELNYFLSLKGDEKDFLYQPEFLSNYVQLDDMDILWMIKRSVNHPDRIFAALCKNLLERKLLKVSLSTDESRALFLENKRIYQEAHLLSESEIEYFFAEKKEVIYPYDTKSGEINMLMKSGKVFPYSALNTHLNTQAEERTFLFYVKNSHL